MHSLHLPGWIAAASGAKEVVMGLAARPVGFEFGLGSVDHYSDASVSTEEVVRYAKGRRVREVVVDATRVVSGRPMGVGGWRLAPTRRAQPAPLHWVQRALTTGCMHI
jgi:hypothetical protein